MENPEWVVTKVMPHEDYTLTVEFFDGSIKKINMSPVIAKGKIFSPLKDVNVFMKAHETYGTVAWSEKIDIAPEYLYENGVDVK